MHGISKYSWMYLYVVSQGLHYAINSHALKTKVMQRLGCHYTEYNKYVSNSCFSFYVRISVGP
jgi:hypothetical protein